MTTHVTLLPFTPPYDVEALLAAQRTHAVPGLDAPAAEGEPATEAGADAAHIRRGIRVAGVPTVLEARFSPSAVEVRSGVPLDDAAVRLVRRWLDLDADPAGLAGRFASDPLLGRHLAAHPGVRVLGHVDDVEAAAFAVLGQQVSLAAARTFQRRFVAAFGVEVPGGGGARVAPAASVVAALSPDEVRDALGITRARASALHTIVTALADGLVLDGDADEAAAVRDRLLALRGIGPWTADYLALRAVGDRDAFPVGDLVLRRALGAADQRAATALGEPWRPARAYATFLLWTEAAYLPHVRGRGRSASGGADGPAAASPSRSPGAIPPARGCAARSTS